MIRANGKSTAVAGHTAATESRWGHEPASTAGRQEIEQAGSIAR